MAHILHGYMRKEKTAVLLLHISRKIVQYSRVLSFIFTHQPLLASTLYSDFVQRHRILSTRLLNQECLKNRLILDFKNRFILSFTNI